jgi:capsular polysaccharide biosynthesis protein
MKKIENALEIVHSLPEIKAHVRKSPTNYAEADDELFELKTLITLPPMNLYRVRNCFVHEDGAVEVKSKVYPQSVRNPSDMMSHYTPFKMLKRQLFHRRESINSDRPIVDLSDHWSGEFYHWLIEALPRLIFYRSQLKNPLLLLSVRHQQSFHQKTLAMLGLGTEDIVYMKNKSRNKLREVYFCDFPGPIDFHRAELIDQLASELLSAIGCHGPVKPWRKVYLSRQKARHRRIINAAKFEHLVTEMGFEVVYAEELDLAEQMKLFYETQTLISLHGAGLSNIIFMQPGTQLIEMRKDRLGYFENGEKQTTALQNTYWHLANIKEITYYYLTGAAEDPRANHHADLYIDLEKTRALLNSI